VVFSLLVTGFLLTMGGEQGAGGTARPVDQSDQLLAGESERSGQTR